MNKIIIILVVLFLILFITIKTIISDILKINFSLFNQLIITVVMMLISVSSFLPFIKTSLLYNNIYYISFTILGFLLNFFLFILVKFVLNVFITFPNILNQFLFFYIPLLLNIYGLINAKQTKVENINIKFTNKKIKNTKICHITDLHLGCIYQKKLCDYIVEQILYINPDIIIITGDLFDMSLLPDIKWLENFKKIEKPILYITGNHEEMLGKENCLNIIKQTNFIHLGDEIKPYIYNDIINFIGIDYNYDIKERLKDIEIVNKNYLNILLTHVPYYNAKELNETYIDLLLCGHTHGGQTLPIWPLSYINSKCFKGLYKYLEKYVFVSQGIGTSTFPMRMGSNSLISVINLE